MGGILTEFMQTEVQSMKQILDKEPEGTIPATFYCCGILACIFMTSLQVVKNHCWVCE
jgi:hypothetical protein